MKDDIVQPNPYEAPTTVDDGVVDPDQFFDGRLRTAALGLKLIYAGILLVLISWIVAIPLSILGIATPIGGGIFNLGILLGILLVNAGPFLCLTVPAESGLRPFAALAVTAQLLALGGILFLIASAAPQVAAFVALLTLFLTLISTALFLLFLDRLARCIQRADLVKRTRNVAVAGSLILLVLAPFSMLIDSTAFSVFGTSFMVFVAFTIVFLFVAYANLVNALSDAIRRPHMSKTPEGIA